MKETLNRLINHEQLSKTDARTILVNIAKGDYNGSQIAAFLTVYMMRSITIEELEGFRDALLDLCLAIDLAAYDPIDLCGTGGDGKDTFNISTLASFVTAGAGIKVTKHGNYGVSSTCGSSNVMEFLGIKFSSDADFLEKSIDQAGICVLHAPLFHPAMKNVAPIRRELGVKTFFNMLGPMVNPAFPKNQMVGVFNLELARMYGYLYQNTDKKFTVLHALDGYDEISLTGRTKTISNLSEGILEPEDFGVKAISHTDIIGGNSIADSAKIFMEVLEGRGTEAQNNVVCANAGIAIATVKEIGAKEGFELAMESLRSGNGLKGIEEITRIEQLMDILEKIVVDKHKEVLLKKSIVPLAQLEEAVLFGRNTFSLAGDLKSRGAGIIAEHKRRSPSKSIINQDCKCTGCGHGIPKGWGQWHVGSDRRQILRGIFGRFAVGACRNPNALTAKRIYYR